MTDASIVIPSIKDDVRTLDSIPGDFDDVEVYGAEHGSLNEARNVGVEAADHRTIIVVDDDVSFDPRLLRDAAERADAWRLVGMADWDFNLVAGRFMAFDVDLWHDVGGFDERLGSHMGDTDFAIKAVKAGADIGIVPREVIEHEEHERSVTTWDRAWRLAYLAGKHPSWAPRLASGVL